MFILSLCGGYFTGTTCNCSVNFAMYISHLCPYRLLLYLSLFGFTLEPRRYRSRFSPPRTFLHHINFSSLERQKLRSEIFSSPSSKVTTFSSLSTVPAHIDRTSSNTCNSGPSLNHIPSSKSASVNSASAQTSSLGSNSHKTAAATRNTSHKDKAAEPSGVVKTEQSASLIARLALGNLSGDRRYTWEYAVMLPTTPDEVRNEVDILLSDLIVRLKQLLFNSLLCAYYVGFIPMLFADVSNLVYWSISS